MRQSNSPKLRDKRRLIGISLFLLALFCLLIIQFFRIQIVQHKIWVKKADIQHTVVIDEPFRRGVFFSSSDIRSSHPSQPTALVIDVPKFHLYIDPKLIPKSFIDPIVLKFSKILEFDQEQLISARTQFDKESRSRKITKWISTEKKNQLNAWWSDFSKTYKIPGNAIYFIKDYQRSYPYGKLLGQVLHTVREARDEKTKTNIPTGGLEHVFNDFLKGSLGKRLIYRSPRHAMDMGRIIEPPKNGADIYLTINHTIQTICEEEIEKQVKKAQAKSGWAIMMDPHSGEIIALAQYPFFDPSHYRKYYNEEELLEHTHVKALISPFEPGSTMKAITVTIALMANKELEDQGKEPLFDPVEMISSLPRSFPGRVKPIKDIRNHRYMNMYMAVQKSSNVYMATLVERIIEKLGDEWYIDKLQNVFGFGKKTGIEMPGECPGLFPLPGQTYSNGTLQWSKPTPYSLAMGYNLMVNSFQMLRNYSIICNGGMDVKPTLIRKIIETSESGECKTLVDNTFIREDFEKKCLIDSDITRQVVCSMKYVTKPGGAAAKADINGFSEAGKTSTTEKLIQGEYSKKNHVSTFIGFAPADDPRFVLLILIDEPAYKFIPGVGNNQYGGNCAAPAFKKIGWRTLKFLGVEPDDPCGYPIGDPRRDYKKADWFKEVDALKHLYEAWN